MHPLLTKLETTLEPLFKELPSLPKNAKDWLVKAWPIIALVFGILQLLSALALWRLGHSVDHLIDYTNDLVHTYGGYQYTRHLGLFYWLSLIVIVVDAVILLLAYSPLRTRLKRGWDLLFLAGVINSVYGFVSAFDGSYGGITKFISALIGTAVIFYFLYQVRPYYLGKTAEKSGPAAKHATHKK